MNRASVVVLYLGALGSTVEGLDFIARARLYNDLQTFEKNVWEKICQRPGSQENLAKKTWETNKPVKKRPSYQLDPKAKWPPPGDSKCPFHPLVGGHLTPWKGHLTIPKRSLWITWQNCFLRFLWVSMVFVAGFCWCWFKKKACSTTRSPKQYDSIMDG